MFLKNLTEIEITEILGMVVWLITSLWGLLGDWLTKGACPRHWRNPKPPAPYLRGGNEGGVKQTNQL